MIGCYYSKENTEGRSAITTERDCRTVNLQSRIRNVFAEEATIKCYRGDNTEAGRSGLRKITFIESCRVSPICWHWWAPLERRVNEVHNQLGVYFKSARKKARQSRVQESNINYHNCRFRTTWSKLFAINTVIEVNGNIIEEARGRSSAIHGLWFSYI